MPCTLHTPSQRHTHARRVAWVAGITLLMMGAEIFGGLLFGSMALLADGIHMGTHFLALGLTLFAYRFAERHARNERFAFGTGKVGVLGGYTSALLLIVSAFTMAIEALERLWNPEPIDYSQALILAIVGLIVNLISAKLLGEEGHSHEDHEESEDHEEHGHKDHNLEAAYLHVLADALTSVAAIAALLAGLYLGWQWLDAAVALAGGALVLRWGLQLLRSTGSILLDHGEHEGDAEKIHALAKSHGAVIEDLHIWRLDEHRRALLCSISGLPQASQQQALREALKALGPYEHCTVEARTL